MRRRAAAALVAVVVGALGVGGARSVHPGAVPRIDGLERAARYGDSPGGEPQVDEQLVRIALAVASDEARISASSDWRIYAADGATILAAVAAGDVARFAITGNGIRIVTGDAVAADVVDGPLIVRPAAWAGLLLHAGRRYRGDILVHRGHGGLTVVNRLPIDEYLKGVVPMEIGSTRTMQEFAAAEAQAVAARSYAYARLGWRGERRLFDLRPTVVDQAYGGVDAETTVGTRAVESTAGLVLKYDGRVVNAPYHSTCGGATAEAPEVWPTRGEPFLQRVSDRVAGTERFYCDISPRFRWTRELSVDRLDAAVGRYLRDYARVPGDGPGHVRGIAVVGRTLSGRVGSVTITTSRGGPYTLSGNDARFVLRSAHGEILNSPWFSIEPAPATGHRASRFTVRGAGYGHGVGMCQWGAIGRARAGQDFRTILATYFPGTTVEPVK